MRELYLVGSGFMPILPVEKISSVLTTSHCISFNFVQQNWWKIQTIHRVEAWGVVWRLSHWHQCLLRSKLSWSKRWVVYSVSPHPVTRLGESGKGIQVICQPRKSCKKTCKFTKYKLLILWCGKWPVNIAYFGKLRRTKLGRHFLVTIQWLQPRISGHESVAVLFGDSKDVTSLKVGQIQSSIDIILIHILTIHYVSLCTGKVHNCSILSCWLDYLVGWSLAFILDWKMSTTQCNAISVCLRHESLSV